MVYEDTGSQDLYMYMYMCTLFVYICIYEYTCRFICSYLIEMTDNLRTCFCLSIKSCQMGKTKFVFFKGLFGADCSRCWDFSLTHEDGQMAWCPFWWNMEKPNEVLQMVVLSFIQGFSFLLFLQLIEENLSTLRVSRRWRDEPETSSFMKPPGNLEIRLGSSLIL